MYTRLTRFLFTLVTTAFCTIAFASSLTDGAQGTAALNADGIDQTGGLAKIDVPGSIEISAAERFLLAQKTEKGGDGDKDKDKDTDKKLFVYVCRVFRDGSFSTKKLPIGTALKLIQQHPNQWLLGRCEDIISPS